MGLTIDIDWDSSVNSAPASFQTAVLEAVQYLEGLFANPITITIDVGYGEIDGQALVSNALGESLANYVPESYSAVRSALIAEDAPGSSTLPATSPDGGTLAMSTAEAKALGLEANNGSVDGYVGFSDSLPFSYADGTTPPSSEYYFIGVVEHEITEDMGRVSLLPYQPDYAPIDLYRYSSPGVRDLSTGGTGSTAYFSIDGGTTNLGTWNNNPSNGDLADWYPSGPAPGGSDSFDDYTSPGVVNVVSQNDVTLMNALGWTVPTTTIATNGTTSLVEVESQFALDPVGGGSGPFVMYQGSVVTAGEFGSWTPIGAVKTASGYEVAWKVAGADEYAIWNTDGNGNYTGNAIGIVSGESYTLEEAELTFGEDLNGDGTIGPKTTTIAGNTLNPTGQTQPTMINPGENTASASPGLSAPSLILVGSPDALALGSSADKIELALAPSCGIETTANFIPAKDELNIGFEKAANSLLQTYNTPVYGVNAIALASSAGLAIGSVLPDVQGGTTAAELLATHTAFSGGHALMG
jgi:tryptophan-rich protein